MRKVTKIVTFLLVFALMLAPVEMVMAGSINENEESLIEFGNSTFTYNGVDYVATDAAKTRVYNYLMQDDVNLSASQAAQARNEFYANIATGIAEGYLVPVSSPEEGADGSTGEGEVVVVEYTYTDMTATMYTKQSVNVRTLPSTSGEKIGSLSANQEVTVTGQCVETGWYRINYNGSTAYVSDNYLSDSKAEVETEATEVTEVETETELVTESETEITEVTEVETETELTTETEKAEVTLKNKDFNKGIDVTTVAIVIAVIALAGAVIVVVSHKNRRYRK